MSSSLILDPRSEDATNAPLEIFRDPGLGAGVYLVADAYPDPEQENYSSAAREGELVRTRPRVSNRKIQLELFVVEGDGPAAVNLLTNPSFEVNLTGASAITSSATLNDFSRSTAWSRYSEASAHFKATATGGGATATVIDAPSPPAVVVGRTYFARAHISALSIGAVPPALYVAWYTAGSVLVSRSTIATAPAAVGESILYGTAVAPATAAFGVVEVGNVANLANGNVLELYVDDRMLVDQTAAGAALGADYFDGDTAGGSWSGTPHASTSSRLAAGGPRIDAIVANLEEKLQKLRDEGGTLSRPFSAGREIFDVRTARGSSGGEFVGRRYRQGGYGTALELEAAPYARGVPSTGALVAEAAKPVLEIVQAAPAGSAWALGDLAVTEASAVARLGLVAGVEVADFQNTAGAAAANTETYLQAEALTPLGGGATAVQAGAQGAGNNVVAVTLDTEYQGLLSTTKLAGAVDLAHVGTFAIWARVYAPAANAGDVTLRFAYAQSDLLVERLEDPKIVPLRGDFWLCKLGVIRLTKARAGTQRWRGRILGKSSVAGDTIRLDDLRIIPAGEAYVEISASTSYRSPDQLVARDGFAQAAGALTGKVLPSGQTWTAVASTDADDFNVDGSGLLTRNVNGDVNTETGRIVTAGVANQASIGASVDFSVATPPDGSAIFSGVVTRLTDVNNYVRAGAIRYSQNGTVYLVPAVYKRLAGVTTPLLQDPAIPSKFGRWTPGAWYTTTFIALSSGLWFLWLNLRGAPPVLWGAGRDSDLATGTLSTGKFGIADTLVLAFSSTNRSYDNFRIWTPSVDVVAHPSKKAYWRSDRAERDDAAGAGLSPLIPDGDLLLIPPRRREGRYLRLAAFMTRGDLGNLPDNDPGDDLSGQLTTTPRYLSVRA